MKWQHFVPKSHGLVGYCHMFTIKHYDTLIYIPDQNFNFSNPSLCNFDLRWQILTWLYLIDNHFTEITVLSVRDRCYQVLPHKINLNSNTNFGMQGNKMVLFITTDLDFWGLTFAFIFRDQVCINTKNVTGLTQFIIVIFNRCHFTGWLTVFRSNETLKTEITSGS